MRLAWIAPHRRNRDSREDASEARLDRQSIDFHLRVLEGYERIAELEPQRFRMVDGHGEPGAVAERVWAQVGPLLRSTLMPSFPDFYGNASVAHTLAQMIGQDRISQTILLSGPEGIGKATLARRFAAALLGDSAKIERDDLSLPDNLEVIEQREKWPAEKRAEIHFLLHSSGFRHLRS